MTEPNKQLTPEQAALQRDWEIEQGITSSDTPGNRPEDDVARQKVQESIILEKATPNIAKSSESAEDVSFRQVLESLPEFTSEQVNSFMSMGRPMAIEGLKASKKYGKAFAERLKNWTPEQRTWGRLKDLPSANPPTWLKNIANSTPMRFMNEVVGKTAIDTAKVLGDIVVDSTIGVPTRFVQSRVTGKELSLKDVLPGASAFASINPEMAKGYDAADKTEWGKATADAFQLAQEAVTGANVVKLLAAPTRFVQAERSILGSKGITEAGKVGEKGSSLLSKGVNVVKKTAPYVATAYGAEQLRSAIKTTADKGVNVVNQVMGGGKDEKTAPEPTTTGSKPGDVTNNYNTTNNYPATTPGSDPNIAKLLAGIAGIAAPVVRVALSDAKGKEAAYGGSLGYNKAKAAANLAAKKKRKGKKKKKSKQHSSQMVRKTPNNKKDAKLENNKVKGSLGKSELRKDKKASLPGSPTQSSGLKEKHGK